MAFFSCKLKGIIPEMNTYRESVIVLKAVNIEWEKIIINTEPTEL